MEDEYEEDNMWDDDQESPGYDQEAENQAIQQECTEVFASRDYIMEPGVFNHLKRYFQAGGAPEQVVQLLSENYTAVAQMVNLLAEWLILAGVSINEVQQMVEDHLKAMILKYFDPKKADSIFTDEGETPAWLTAMIEHPSWRSLIYKLAEDYPDCLMLNFTIKLISDAGFQGEITSISTAAQQIEVFSRVLRTSIASFLEGGEESLEKNLPEFVKMVCHGEHTYLYSQALLKLLSQETKGGANIRRLAQEVHKCARIKGHEVTPITMALSGATAYPRACQALASMLGRNALNPADINVLYKVYTTNDSPPVDLIRVPHFLELFINALFKPGSNINQEHKTKYFYILAYACSVYETNKKGGKRVVNKDELKPTTQALEKAHTICRESKGASELIVEVNTLHQCIRFPVVALGVLRWVDYTVSEKSYFKLNTDHTPLHLALLDEISSCHVQLHSKILDLLVRLFKSPFEELDVLVQLELKKTLLDRMVHLLSRGYVVPVVSYIRKCWEKQDTDISLIRHFVTEVLDIIAPPYTSEFVQLFLPLVENEDITGPLKNENDSDPVADFIVHCKSNYIVVG